MQKRGAIELSMSFLVIILISVVIFGFGIRFIYTLTKQANDIQSMSVQDIDSRISNLICEGNSKVCIGVDRKTIRKEGFDVFGIKIVNVLSTETSFFIDAVVTKGIDKKGDIISSPLRLIVNPEKRVETIEKNDERLVGIGIEVPPNTVSGTYIVDVKITSGANVYGSPVYKLYVDVP